jgi:hypothetical protein
MQLKNDRLKIHNIYTKYRIPNLQPYV